MDRPRAAAGTLLRESTLHHWADSGRKDVCVSMRFSLVPLRFSPAAHSLVQRRTFRLAKLADALQDAAGGADAADSGT